MRSRYTAFVRGDAAYLLETWHPGTRPETLEVDPAVHWWGLEILDVDGGDPGDRRGTVEFVARWREPGREGELHERSRFARQSGRWWYVDGRIR